MYPVTSEFLELIRADARQIKAKVEISYTDPMIDQSIDVEASENANVSYPAQTADSVSQVPHKWMSLDGSCTLDGSYHLAPLASDLTRYQFGWWGSQISGADGSFASPYPALTVMHLPRPIHTLTVAGDSARGECPVDFTISLYAENDTLLHTQTVTANTDIAWSLNLSSPVLDVAKQVLTITKWSHSGRQAKIVEFFTSVQESYLADDLTFIQLLEEREVSQGSLPVGNISSNEISIGLVNNNKKFDPDNPYSPLNQMLKPNRKIRAWIWPWVEGMTEEPPSEEFPEVDPPTFTRSSVAYKSDGTQVSANVPRFEDGKFGKAVLVEEGTTNAFNNPSFEDGTTGWGTVGFSDNTLLTSVTDDVYSGSKAVKVERVSGGLLGIGATISQAIGTRIVLAQNQSVTVSFYVKGKGNTIGKTVRVYIYASDGANIVLQEKIYTLTGEWQRISYTLTWPYATSTTAIYGYCRVENINIGDYFYVDDAQLEAKPYATSFIDGTRSPETLTIPTAGVFPDINNFTIELWAKAQTIKTDTYQGIFGGRGILGAPPVDLLIATDNQLHLYYYNSAGTNTPLATGYYISDRTNWHYYAVTFCNGTVRIYVDGIKVKEANITLAQTTGNGNFYIGRSIVATEYWNGLIDDLRISSIARSDDEIAAAESSGRRLDYDIYSTYKLNFDGDLSLAVRQYPWVPLGTFWSLDWNSSEDNLEATVTARDRLDLLRKTTFETSVVQTNATLYSLAEQVLQDAGLTAAEYTIDTSLQSITIPYTWFGPISHREALRRIAEAGLAVVYADRDGIIQVKAMNSFGDDELEITADEYYTLRNPSHEAGVSNKIIVDTNPLAPQASQEVYRSNTPISIPASSAKTITAFYNMTPVINALATLDGSPAGVEISSATYYGWGASVKIQNNNASSVSVTLVITGQPLTVQNKERYIAQDNSSILEYGEIEFRFPDNPLVQTLSQAECIATGLLASVKNLRRDIDITWRGNPALLLGDKINIKGTQYYVTRQELEWRGYLDAKINGRKVE